MGRKETNVGRFSSTKIRPPPAPIDATIAEIAKLRAIIEAHGREPLECKLVDWRKDHLWPWKTYLSHLLTIKSLSVKALE